MVLPEPYAAGKSVSPASDQSARQVKTSSEARKIECFEPDRQKVWFFKEFSGNSCYGF